jgi:hypothetical protein
MLSCRTEATPATLVSIQTASHIYHLARFRPGLVVEFDIRAGSSRADACCVRQIYYSVIEKAALAELKGRQKAQGLT